MNGSIAALIDIFVRAYHAKQAENEETADCLEARMLGQEDYERLALLLKEGIALREPDFDGDDSEALRRVVYGGLAPAVLTWQSFSEEAFRREIRLGAKQYILLNVGYDCFAYRAFGPAGGLRLLLIDRPELLADRRVRAKRAGLQEKIPCCEIAADLTQSGWFDALASAQAFSRSERAIVGMQGLVGRLDGPALGRMLGFLGGLLAEGSALIFDYRSAGSDRVVRKQGMQAHATGALYGYGCTRPELERLLGEHGFLVYEHLSPAQLAARYSEGCGTGSFDAHALHGMNCVLAVRKG